MNKIQRRIAAERRRDEREAAKVKRQERLAMKVALKEQAEEAAFLRKTSNIYAGQVKRARNCGQEVMYSLEALRAQCRRVLAADTPCPYTGKPIQLKTMVIDHADPISQGGRFTLDNSIVCSKAGNERKGPLTAMEFASLRTTVEVMSNAATRAYIWGKMRQPSKHFGGAR